MTISGATDSSLIAACVFGLLLSIVLSRWLDLWKALATGLAAGAALYGVMLMANRRQ